MWISRLDPPWKHRVKVLMRVVEGMRYLQEEWPEVGYDLKSSSILLAEDREPLISRFRIEDQSSCNKKAYKFGVLLLEMVTNRSPRKEFERGEAGFVEWVRMHFPKNVCSLIDEKKKRTEHTLDQATRSIELGLMCTDMSRGMQPRLDQIFEKLTAIYNSILAWHLQTGRGCKEKEQLDTDISNQNEAYPCKILANISYAFEFLMRVMNLHIND
ncbi:hypothetical protein Vadar_015007 [Vaccinium darrowii]|uniref:Uncharacterized protein n=1 Tax=Vaccinium darrowii TaxID=229202 RepID=A0ACB7X9V1_9ERIC|nr:hypothetical protein Vadar_015007 [Vaccinium darrowii]